MRENHENPLRRRISLVKGVYALIEIIASASLSHLQASAGALTFGRSLFGYRPPLIFKHRFFGTLIMLFASCSLTRTLKMHLLLTYGEHAKLFLDIKQLSNSCKMIDVLTLT